MAALTEKFPTQIVRVSWDYLTENRLAVTAQTSTLSHILLSLPLTSPSPSLAFSVHWFYSDHLIYPNLIDYYLLITNILDCITIHYYVLIFKIAEQYQNGHVKAMCSYVILAILIVTELLSSAPELVTVRNCRLARTILVSLDNKWMRLKKINARFLNRSGDLLI